MPVFRFKKDSHFEFYILKNYKGISIPPSGCFSFVFIIRAIYCIIFMKNLFDPNNPAIILCDEALDRVLKMGALHFRTLPKLIYNLLDTIEGYKLDPVDKSKVEKEDDSRILVSFSDLIDLSITQPPWGCSSAFGVVNSQPLKPLSIKFDWDFKYLPSEKLHEVLVRSKKVGPERSILFYRDIWSAVGTYILENQTNFIDLRNPLIVRVPPGDPLSEAFGGVISFSRCQLIRFINSQLSMPGKYNQTDISVGIKGNNLKSIYLDLDDFELL